MCVLRRKVLVMATRDMMEQMKVRAVTMAMTAETQKKKQHSPEYEKKTCTVLFSRSYSNSMNNVLVDPMN
jgi:hypothetical protein